VIYLVFFLIALAALVARLRGTWSRARAGRSRRFGLPALVNLLAVLWQGFEFVNVAWPRSVLAPAGAPWYQVWAAPLVTCFVTLTGLAYLLTSSPQRRFDPDPTAQPAPALPG
jgi:hypothetical protein